MIQPSFAFENDDRHLAYFHVNTSAGNVLGWLIVRKGDYLMFCRNRTYLDNLIGPESKDVRTAYLKRVPAPDDQAAIVLLQVLCDMLTQGIARGAPLWGLPTFTFHEFKMGTWQDVMDTLRLDAGFTMMTGVAVDAEGGL